MRKFCTLVWVFLLIIAGCSALGDWVAYNDHVPTSGLTHSNTTTLKIPSSTNGPISTNIVLKDIRTGTNVGVVLTISRTGPSVYYNQGGAQPAAGTPLYNAFSGFVSFATAPDSSVELTNASVTYAFSGLDPQKRYSFVGGANRGSQVNTASNKFTRVEIQGAISFQNAHSSRVITAPGPVGDLNSNQVVVNFATNTVSGSIVKWDEIRPAADGTFSVTCSQYLGLQPNGPSNGTNAYAITGIRLEELPSGPPVFLTQPQNQTVAEGQSVTFTANAIGAHPLSYQWLRNDVPIAGSNGTSLILSGLLYADSGSRFSVIASNALGAVTSSNAVLIVTKPPFNVLSYSNVWKYNQDGVSLGTAWHDVVYDDSQWPSGPGVLGVETDNQIVLPLTNTVLSLTNAAARTITYYFRTHFQITNDLESISVVSSNLIDDGVVLYLNGEEIYRYNLAAAPAVITSTTLATASIEAVWMSNPLPPSVLRQGDNVLTAEVHQASATSSDIVFGLQIMAFYPPPTQLVITNEPADITVEEGTPVSLHLGFTGAPATIQWFKDDFNSVSPIPGATLRDLTFTTPLSSDSGRYFAVISNAVNQVTSKVATLVVTVDETPPRLVSVQAGTSSSQVVMTFSEPITPETVANIANYSVTNVSSGGTIGITSATLVNGTTVLLTLAQPRSIADNYLVRVNNLTDVSLRHNAIASGSILPIEIVLPLIELSQPGWAFYNPVFGPPWEPYEAPDGWNEVNFSVPQDDWGQDAAGLFAFNPSQRPMPYPVNTSISGGAISSFFRFPFFFDASPVGAKLSLQRVVADGVLTYLNGKEIERFNLPTGNVTVFTPALTSIVDPIDTGLRALPELPIHYGSNVLAAELHSYSTSDDSLVFGEALTARVLSWARGPVLITAGPDDVTVFEGQSAQFHFVAIGAKGFNWLANGVSISNAETATLTLENVPLNVDGLQIRVVATNATDTAQSRTATLRVLPDIIPPRVIDASFTSNGVEIAFSEPMLELSVTNISNYAVTNDSGQTLTLIAVVPSDSTRVRLVFDDPVTDAVNIVLHGVRDASARQNPISPNTVVRPGLDLKVPFSSVWRYFTNAVDLGTAWRERTYNDTALPWSAGPGLIADETASLPEPILTPISRLDNGQYHYTFYFRYHFNLPFAVPSLPVTFRHVIDDGALFYINGQPFHSFNMSATPSSVDYNTQASVNVGDAVYSGPDTVLFTNLVAGDNVIAVEVHQSGTASSDVTFGAEFSAHVPSTISAPASHPFLKVTRLGNDFITYWSDQSFTLEASDVLGPNATWIPLATQTNLYQTHFDQAQRFFRLR